MTFGKFKKDNGDTIWVKNRQISRHMDTYAQGHSVLDSSDILYISVVEEDSLDYVHVCKIDEDGNILACKCWHHSINNNIATVNMDMN